VPEQSVFYQNKSYVSKTAVFEIAEAAALNEGGPMDWLTDVLERMVSGRTKARVHA
jgi:hypothetical protein